jgi:hypothetical protein
MGGVPFLPEELGGAQEQPGAHLPAHHVGPLVDEQGQVAVGSGSSRVGIPDDGLGGGPHDELFFQPRFRVDDHAVPSGRFQAVVGDHGALLGETLDMLGLPAQEALGMNSGK